MFYKVTSNIVSPVLRGGALLMLAFALNLATLQPTHAENKIINFDNKTSFLECDRSLVCTCIGRCWPFNGTTVTKSTLHAVVWNKGANNAFISYDELKKKCVKMLDDAQKNQCNSSAIDTCTLAVGVTSVASCGGHLKDIPAGTTCNDRKTKHAYP